MRPTTWNVSGLLGYTYNYDYFNEHTGRVTYAGSTYDLTLDRSYEYDQVGRLAYSHSGAEARAHAWTGQWGTMDGPYSQDYSYDVWGNMTQRHGWGGEVQGGSPTQSTTKDYTYTNNRRTDNGFTYDPAGNLTWDGGQSFQYDVTGQQTYASYLSVSQSYDGDGLRVKKTENGDTTYYLRSSVLGGQIVCEIKNWGSGWDWYRGYVYAGSNLLAVQQDGGVYWMHEDPITKSRRVTNVYGSVVSTIELDPWGADTNRSSSAAFQPKKFTSYSRDDNGTDEAMFRRYNRWHSRFDQPDPHEGSYDLADPQSFNRYAYVQNDPVTFVDPSGLMPRICGLRESEGGGIEPVYCADDRSSDYLFVLHSRYTGFTGVAGKGTGGRVGDPQNPLAQPTLGPCNLTTPSFGDLVGHPALGLLSGPFDDDPEALYNSLGTYNQAVLLNTTAALADAGVNLSNANFIGFYRSNKPGHVAYGINVTGVTTSDLDKAGLGDSLLYGRRSPGSIKEGSLEATVHGSVISFDVDLYNPKSNKRKHLGEVNYNNSHNTTTHPGDVARQLAGRGVDSGVRCPIFSGAQHLPYKTSPQVKGLLPVSALR